ncbi:DinB family protein [Flagellimonas sp. S174]|uniref:DinB family protein n=1 Tax=Flagellimonas sp. S174 TaxID=3410790 RepID=UPI003BF4F932
MKKEELIKKWKGNKRYTLKFVDLMPEEDLDFKPVDGMKAYKSQLSHITSWLRTHSRFVTDQEFPKVKMTSKELVQNALEEFFDTFIEHLEAMNDDQLHEVVDVWYGKSKKYQIANVMDNHLSHHRGQMVVYLRHKNIKPPSYIGW